MSNEITSIDIKINKTPTTINNPLRYEEMKSGFFYSILSILTIGRKLIISDGERQLKYFIFRADMPRTLKNYGWFWFSPIRPHLHALEGKAQNHFPPYDRASLIKFFNDKLLVRTPKTQEEGLQLNAMRETLKTEKPLMEKDEDGLSPAEAAFRKYNIENMKKIQKSTRLPLDPPILDEVAKKTIAESNRLLMEWKRQNPNWKERKPSESR